MIDEVKAGQEGATEQPGSEGIEREPDTTGPVDAEREPEETALESNEEPSGEGSFDGMTPEQLHKSWKELQTELGKRTENYKELEKKLEPFGGADKVVEWAGFLANNPRFAEWVQQEQQRSATGDMGEMDEETKKAVDLVYQIADKVADAKVAQALRDRVEPLASNYKEELIGKHFSKMDEVYGSEWREVQDTMAEISEGLPEKVQDNPTFDDIEDIYWKALRKSGKLDTTAAKIYEKKLKEKQSKSTPKPETKPGSAPARAKTIQEAFEMAKRAG